MSFLGERAKNSGLGGLSRSYAVPMGYARKSLVSLQDTPYYHVVSRCVRRAWLWGVDEYAGKDYSHRKQWIIDRLAQLSQIFAIEICAYAVMSNHYHLVLFVDKAQAVSWSRQEIVERWHALFRLPELVKRWRSGEGGEAERCEAERIIDTWRRRLHDLSWYMRCLNEHLARLANAEDQCTGRFWEGRYRSQALLDEAGLLTAMAYVDLNPIRAGVAAIPEESDFTSIYQRIRQRAPSQVRAARRQGGSAPTVSLQPFSDEALGAKQKIPFRFSDYLALVDWSGRAIRSDKRGAIDPGLPPVLQSLNIDPDAWELAMKPHGNVFGRAIGKLNHLRLHAATLGQSWIRGLHRAARLYGH